MLSRRDDSYYCKSTGDCPACCPKLLFPSSGLPYYYKLCPLELYMESLPAAAIGETSDAKFAALLIRRKAVCGLWGMLSCRCRLRDSMDSAWISSSLAWIGTAPSCATSLESYLRRVDELKSGYRLKVSLIDLLLCKLGLN
jgi:hypothetical protein